MPQMLRLKATRRKGICELRLHCECSLSAFHLSPSAPDHLTEHPWRKPTKIYAACLRHAPDSSTEATPDSADWVECSHVEDSLQFFSDKYFAGGDVIKPNRPRL